MFAYYFLVPFRFECRPLLKIVANDAASEGFSATIKTDFIAAIIFLPLLNNSDLF